MAIYQHIRHPRIAARIAERPVKVADLLPGNGHLAGSTPKFRASGHAGGSGSMCVRLCRSCLVRPDQFRLPDAIRSGTAAIVSWVAQTFLQLVLLSVIMVGQNVQAAAADKRAEATFHDASATLHEVAHLQGHLAAQDELLTRIAERMAWTRFPSSIPRATKRQQRGRTRKADRELMPDDGETLPVPATDWPFSRCGGARSPSSASARRPARRPPFRWRGCPARHQSASGRSWSPRIAGSARRRRCTRP